jgi:hypothetical protein
MSAGQVADWVITGGAPGELGYCTRCGEGLTINLPQRFEVVTGAMLGFVRAHAHCEPGQYFPKPPMNPEEWAAGRDTGISSLTIYRVMTGKPSHNGTYHTPRDPDDFGRCYRLLKLFPQWRSRLPEFAEKFPKWARLIAEWDELTALYEEESPSGTCPKLYDRMKRACGGAGLKHGEPARPSSPKEL